MKARAGRGRLPWWGWLGEAVADVRRDRWGLFQLAWPWYGAAAVVLAQAWLLFGVSPFGPRESGSFWWPALVQEVLLGLSGAAVAVRATRRAAAGEPLVAGLRSFGGALVRYALRFVLAYALTIAAAALVALVAGGVAGLTLLAIPPGSVLLPIKQAAVVLLVVLAFAYVFGRLHLWLAAAALDRRDLDLKATWALGAGRAVPLTAGVLLLHLPALAIDLALLGILPPNAGLAASLPLFLVEAVTGLLFTAALAGFFARLFQAVAGGVPAVPGPGPAAGARLPA